MFTIAFWKDVAERAVKTFVQSFVATLLSSIGAVVFAGEVPWETALSASLGVAVLSTVVSLATSIGNADFTAGITTVHLQVDAEALPDDVRASHGYPVPDAHEPISSPKRNEA